MTNAKLNARDIELQARALRAAFVREAFASLMMRLRGIRANAAGTASA